MDGLDVSQSPAQAPAAAAPASNGHSAQASKSAVASPPQQPIAANAQSGFDLLDGMLDSFESGRLSVAPGALKQPVGPQNVTQAQPNFGPGATAGRGIGGGR